jgi:dTDP-4-dehydrorhamnose reductase
MNKPLIVITGTEGQLGWSLQQLIAHYPQYEFLFTTMDILDLSSIDSIADFFKKYTPTFFINCAAYTAVDKAETEQAITLAINATAVGEIAKHCAAIKATLITISTDYVFDGAGTKPYLPYDATNPVNYYGYTKWLGEKLAVENNPNTIIIRTSWVYAQNGNNFVKTMMRLMNEKESINVVDDQVGCPTYAHDLASAILHIVQQIPQNTKRGIYHYSNTGVISWFQFATAIQQLTGLNCKVNPVPSTAYPTPAKRPSYSVMDLSSIHNDFGVELIDWKLSLEKYIQSVV